MKLANRVYQLYQVKYSTVIISIQFAPMLSRVYFEKRNPPLLIEMLTRKG